MSKKLFIGGLPFSFTEEKLRELFESYGEMSEVLVIKDKFSGRSKGFGFVTFTDDAAAEKAVSEMNGKEVEGRALTVNEARPMEERAPRRSFGHSGGGFGGGRRDFGGGRRRDY
jgi:cold-inducible RNA-binding protein